MWAVVSKYFGLGVTPDPTAQPPSDLTAQPAKESAAQSTSEPKAQFKSEPPVQPTDESAAQPVSEPTIVPVKIAPTSTSPLFEDVEFPPNYSAKYNRQRDDFQWLRPTEVESLKERAQFSDDDYSRFDINQGGLGNCWLLAAIASLSTKPEVLRRVIVGGQKMQGNDYNGAFRFRFQVFGKEKEIVVDDRLPMKPDKDTGELYFVYAKPYNDEYWVCLLEKAAAKLYGCYDALEAGSMVDGLPDFVGGVCEDFFVDTDSLNKMKDRLKCALDAGLIAVAGSIHVEGNATRSTELENEGIITSHAYSITGLQRVAYKKDNETVHVDLIRIFNPWGALGETEWKGKWSDSDPRWTEQMTKQVGLVKDCRDGENWMDVQDFVKHFDAVSILHLAKNLDFVVPDCGWAGRCIPGEFVQGQDRAAFENDERYQIDVQRPDDADDHAEEKTTYVISLEEPDQRRLPSEQRRYAKKWVHIYRASDEDSSEILEPEVVIEGSRRSIQHRFDLLPGLYTMVPGCELPNGVASLRFLLRQFEQTSDHNNHVSEVLRDL